MAPIIHYMMPASPPCRSVMMLARMINVDLENKMCSIMSAEHKSPEFLKMNPQGTLPTINDNGFCLWESHAIMCYMMNKYAPDHKLYPKDPQKRAMIDLMCQFDNATLDKSQRAYFIDVLLKGKPLDPEKEPPFKDALKLLDTFLAKSKYVAGEDMSVADLAILGNLQYAYAMEYDFTSDYPNVKKWWQTMEAEVPGYHEINDGPTAQFKAMVKQIKAGTLKFPSKPQ